MEMGERQAWAQKLVCVFQAAEDRIEPDGMGVPTGHGSGQISSESIA
jgi:hypothetical protein